MAPGLHESGFIKKSSRLLTADDLKAQTSQKKYTLELDIPETIPEDKLKLYHEAQELRQENIDGKLSFYHEDTAKQKVLLINSHFNGDSVSEVKRTRDGQRYLYRVSCDWEKMKTYYREILDANDKLVTPRSQSKAA